ncbi:hypothetical protein V1506DRAFT_522860 [Lipomyces tetrasporus]
MEPALARYRVIRFENITNTANLTLAKRGNPTYGWRVDYWDIANRCTTKPSGYYNYDNYATSTRPWASTSRRSGRWPATCRTSPPSPPSGDRHPAVGPVPARDVEMRCNILMTRFMRKTLKDSLATLVARLVVKSQLQENIKNNRRLTYAATQHSFSPPMSPPLSPPLPQYAMLATPPVGLWHSCRRLILSRRSASWILLLNHARIWLERPESYVAQAVPIRVRRTRPEVVFEVWRKTTRGEEATRAQPRRQAIIEKELCVTLRHGRPPVVVGMDDKDAEAAWKKTLLLGLDIGCLIQWTCFGYFHA